MLRTTLVWHLLAVGSVVALWASPASAQPTERRGRYLQNAEFTNVVDALESDDPFDLNLSVGYLREARSSRIRRESNNVGVSPDGYIGVVDLASYEQLTNTLVLSGAVGLFRDVQLWTRWPLILSDTRELTLDDGVSLEQSRLRRSCYEEGDGTDVCLFDVPFKSPERSGVDAFTLGLDWGVLNQLRDDTKPTWVVGVEATIGIGSALVATDANDPSAGDGGISRGVTRLTAHTEFSRRYRYVEPYIGTRFSADLPQSDTGFPEADIEGRLNTIPPLVGAMIFGAEFVPWESMEAFQRFSADLRMTGTFNSEGRTQSELFDALGTSQHRQLREADGEGHVFNGMTDVENYGTFATALTLNVQAARYVKFQLGASLAYDQQHGVTFTDACDPEADVAVAQAPCSHGAPNPDHRATIDLPGHRFRVEGSTVFQFFAAGTAMF